MPVCVCHFLCTLGVGVHVMHLLPPECSTPCHKHAAAACLFPESLQAAKLAADLAEARDAAETRGSAVAALEAALAAVERGEARQCAGMPATRGRARTPPRQRADVGTEPGADAAAQVDGADVDGDSTAAVAPASVPSAPISRELVKAQLANADLQRKLRVSAR